MPYDEETAKRRHMKGGEMIELEPSFFKAMLQEIRYFLRKLIC